MSKNELTVQRGISDAEVSDVLARIRARTNLRPPAMARPASSSRAARLPATCARTGTPFIVEATMREDPLKGAVLHLDGAMRRPRFTPGRPVTAPCIIETFRIEAAPGWACPICNASYEAKSIWMCGCAPFENAMHCGGSRQGYSFCACGKFEKRSAVVVERVEVRNLTAADPVAPRRMAHAGRLSLPAPSTPMTRTKG
jgi:hypothetical protein